MATITNVILRDSLDERISTGVETVRFYDPTFGIEREIELSEQNRKHLGNLIEKMQKYIDASEVVEKPATASKPKAAKKDSETTKIREWAKANGYPIGDRGRIAADIQAAYAAAQEAIANPDTDAQAAGDEPVSKAETVDTDPANLSDDEILSMMSEIEAEQGAPVTLEQLSEAVDKDNEQE